MRLIELLQNAPPPPINPKYIRRCGPGFPPEDAAKKQIDYPSRISANHTYYDSMHGCGWMSADAIAEKMGLHRKSVIEAMRRLIAQGFVQKNKLDATYQWVGDVPPSGKALRPNTIESFRKAMKGRPPMCQAAVAHARGVAMGPSIKQNLRWLMSQGLVHISHISGNSYFYVWAEE